MANCLIFAISYVRLCKKCLHYFCLTKKWMMMEIMDKSDCRIIWYLLAGLKPIILCFVHSVWFVKYLFSAEIWFVKMPTRTVKYKSWVVKLNPEVSVHQLHHELASKKTYSPKWKITITSVRRLIWGKYSVWSWLLVHLCKMMISPAVFFVGC